MFKWWASIINKFVRIFNSFIKAAFPIIKQAVIGQLLPFALQVVKKLEKSDFSNDARRNEAFKEIKNEAKAKGIEIGTSLIFLIIELALQKFKEEK